MAQLARDIMTPGPACCGPNTTLDEIAKLMVQNDCGEIPIIDVNDCVVGVITDRDIVCRVVAEGMNPTGHTAASYMTKPVVCVREDDPLTDVLSTMEKHQIRRVPVIKDGGLCTGIISQADLARVARVSDVAELLYVVSKHTAQPARL